MNHTLFLFAAASVFAAMTPAPSPAQGSPVDTTFLKRFAETRGFMLGRPQTPKFSPDGQTVFFLRADPPVPRLKLFAFDVKTAQTKELLSAEMLLKGAEENLTPEEKARRERQRVSVGGFADYHLDHTGNRILVMLSGKPYIFDRSTAKVREVNVGAGTIVDVKWSPDGKCISYVRDYDVYIYDLATDKESAVTLGGTITKTNGLAEFVAQEEMDRFTGYWWSPDSKYIAYEEADHTGVEVWHIADPLKPGNPPQPQYYPRPGKKNVSVRLGIVPVAGGKTVWVEWDRKLVEYLASVHWDANGPLTVQLQDRQQQHIVLSQIDPATGTLRALHGEQALHPGLVGITSNSWLNLSQSIPRWLPDRSGFIWAGVRNPPKPVELLELRDVNGKLKCCDIHGNKETDVTDVIEVTATHLAYVTRPEPTRTAITVSPILKLDSPVDRKVLTPNTGVHAAVFGSGLSTYALTTTLLDRMPITTIHTQTDGRRIGELPSTAAEPPFTPNVTIQKVDDYYTAVVRPRNFDPKKKYPVIVDVYGGPHHIHVQQAMRNWLIPQWLADQGFIVVAIDNRGTPGRGRRWENAIYQKFGTVPLEDQVKGLHALCNKFPELDGSRVGIVGWSFGGYMAANAVLRRPDIFHAAIAGAPVTDWEDYDTHYTERYLGVLPESRKAYDDACLIPLAKDLQRPLLLVHGTADDNVYYRHTLKLTDALFRAGREFESLPLPGITHMYSADAQITERLWERNVRFFQRHLGSPK